LLTGVGTREYHKTIGQRKYIKAMKIIHKFPLQIVDIQEIYLDWDAQFLSAQMQDGVPTLWAMVNLTNSSGKRTIRIIGTGHPIPEGTKRTYLGTVQQPELGLVWHIFEEI
jgi:hypothetical protein